MADVAKINGYDLKDAGGRALIQQLEAKVDNYHAPYYILVGDSYAYDAVRDGVNVNGWTTWFKQWNSLTEGTDCFTRGEAGAGFSNQSSAGRNFNDILTYIIGTMTDEQKRLTGTVIIAGGTNDMNNANIGADYVTLFSQIKSTVSANLPNCRKVLIAPIGMNNSNRSNRLMAPRLYAAYEAACRYTNFAFAWGAWFYRYDKRYETSDHIHLTNEGTKISCSMITTALNGGTCGWYARETITITPASGYTTATLQFEMILQDGMVTFNKTETNHQFYLDTPGSFQMGSSQHTLGSFNSTILPDNVYIVYRSTGRTHDSANSTFFDAPVLLWFTNTSFNITMPYTEGLSGYKTVSSCDFVGIDFNDFVASAFTM